MRTGIEVSLVVLVGDVPAKRTKLASLLDSGVEESHSVIHGLPLGEVGILQVLLSGVGIGPLQTCLHSFWGFKGVLDGSLEQVDGVFGMDFCGQPQTKVIVDFLSFQDTQQQLIQEVQCQVSVLQQSPATLHVQDRCNGVSTGVPGVDVHVYYV